MGRSKKLDKWHVICTRIPHREVWEKFLYYINKKEGKIKGVAGVYVEKALETYLQVIRLEKTGRVHTQKFYDLCEIMKNYVEAYQKADKKIPIEKIYNEIKIALGIIDERGIKNYYKMLVLQGIIREEHILKNKAEVEAEAARKKIKTLNEIIEKTEKQKVSELLTAAASKQK